MKILVTGANGYLGRGIVKAILDKGIEVIAADFTTELVDNRAVHKACNLFDVENPYEYFENPDILLHLAWRDGFVHYSDAHIEDLHKHYAFLKEMIVKGVNQIAVMGTMHEIGFYEGCIKEDTPCHPATSYGISKNALRDLVKMEASKHNAIFQWLRGYYIVSNTKYGNSIFSKLVAAEEAGHKEFPFTTGQNQYDFLDYEDFCHQVAAVVAQREIKGIINICSGRPEKLADRVERFIKDNGLKISLKYGAYPDREYDSKAVWGCGEKIQTILNNEMNLQNSTCD